jgi:signal transduction histidine kinase
VLAGWALGNEPVKRLLPGLVAMNPLTALCFVLSGLGLFCLTRRTGVKSRGALAWGGRLAGIVIAGVGVLKGCEYLFGWEAGLDRVLFSGQLAEGPAEKPNRMAPNTALGFALTGLGVLMLGSGRRAAIVSAQYLSLLLGFIALLAVTGYAYGATFLYGVGSYIPMALNTALTFMVLAAALVLVEPRLGLPRILMGDGVGSRVASRLLPAAILLPLLLGWLRLLGERRGHFDTEFGVALTVVIMVLLLSGLIGWHAAALNRSDAERRRLEQINLDGRHYAESIVDTLWEPLLILTCDLKVNSANRAFHEMFGTTEESIRGVPLAGLDGGRWNVPELLSALSEIMPRQEELRGFEMTLESAGGPARHLTLNARKLFRPGNHSTLILIAMEDVTARRGHEVEVSRLNEHLRTRAEQLEAANQELEAFSYSVSHDLRAPLRHIDGFAELLRRHAGDGLDDKAVRFLNTISDAARQMGNLIDDLLVFSRTGREELRRSGVKLGGLIEEAIHNLQPELKGRNIRWNIGEFPVVRADPGMMRQVLVNLISNAVKFTRDRDPAEITVGTQASNGEAVVFVRDNGVGFDMEYVGKLFGVFQRLHSADEFEGTGIGLANVRRIIHRHSGRTWAEGQVGHGATFYFTLPDVPEG